MPVVPFTFGRRRLLAIKHEDDLWFTGDDIGTALEYAHPRDAIKKLYQRNKEELDRYSIVIRIPVAYSKSEPKEELRGVSGETCGVSLTPHVGDERADEDVPEPVGAVRYQSVRVFNEEGVMVLTMLSSQPIAAVFRGWAVKILKAYRHGQLVLSNPANRERLLETCIKETRFGNEAAIHTLIAHFGYPETIRLPALPAPGVAALQQPAVVGWFWRDMLPRLADEVREGFGPTVDALKRRRPHFRGWKVVHETGAAFALDHRSGDLYEIVAELAAREGVHGDMTGHLFGRWLNQIEGLLNTQGWTRRLDRTAQGSQIFRLMLAEREGV